MTNKLTFAIGGFVALIVLAFVASEMFSIGSARANPYTATAIGTATTSTAVQVTASTRVLATTTNTVGTGYTRVFASICNPSSTIVALNMNNDKPAGLNGGTASSSVAFIGAAAGYNVCYEITDRNMYSGSIQASSTVGAVTVYATDYVF